MKLWYLNEDTTNGLRYVITVDYMNNRWVDRAKWKAFQNRLGLFYNGGVQIVNLTQFSLWPTFTLAFCWLGCFSKPLIDCFALLQDFDSHLLSLLAGMENQQPPSLRPWILDAVPFIVVLLIAAHVLALVRLIFLLRFRFFFIWSLISDFLSLSIMIGLLDIQISYWERETTPEEKSTLRNMLICEQKNHNLLISCGNNVN